MKTQSSRQNRGRSNLKNIQNKQKYIDLFEFIQIRILLKFAIHILRSVILILLKIIAINILNDCEQFEQ